MPSVQSPGGNYFVCQVSTRRNAAAEEDLPPPMSVSPPEVLVMSMSVFPIPVGEYVYSSPARLVNEARGQNIFIA
ncbi:hypothetical protein H4I96_01183 [Botrytis cinerea]